MCCNTNLIIIFLIITFYEIFSAISEKNTFLKRNSASYPLCKLSIQKRSFQSTIYHLDIYSTNTCTDTAGQKILKSPGQKISRKYLF